MNLEAFYDTVCRIFGRCLNEGRHVDNNPRHAP